MLRFICYTLGLVAFAICGLLPICVAAQDKQPSKHIDIGRERGIDGSDCNITKADFDLIAQTAGEDGLIIAIARLGKGEFSRNLASRRLQNIGKYLYDVRGMPRERIITAEGERVADLGKVEVYLSGKLFMVFHMKRKKDFFRGCMA